MAKVNFTSKDVEIISKEPLYQGFFTMEAYTFRHKLFAGGWSEPVTREVFERGQAVVVLPYDPVSDSVVLIEQIRIPALVSSKTPWLLELVAGMIEPGYSAEEVAHKELFEEAGIKAQEMTCVNSYLASPGGTTERFHFYWARVDASDAKGLHGLESEHEDIRVHVVSRQEAYEKVVSGEIDNASTVIGLMWLQLNYQQIS